RQRRRSEGLRLVLIGRSGAGKSAAGNAILGRDVFESRPDSLVAITEECAKMKQESWKLILYTRFVAVVDTPDWFHSERTPDEVRALISSCVALSSPGPHAFLLCVPMDQPAKLELQSLCALETVFGPNAVGNHTLVLFTHADLLRKSGKAGSDSVEAYIAGQRDDLLKLVEKCGDRFHILERDGYGGSVEELLEKVEQIAAEAGGQCYSSPAFQEAENRVREIQAEIARERRRQKQEEERLGEQFWGERRPLYPYMQTVAEAEEEVREEEVEKARTEAERSVSTMNIEMPDPVLGLVVQQGDQEVDVLDGQSEDLVLAKLFVQWMRGDELPQLREGAVHVLLPPTLAGVGEDAAGNFLRRTRCTQNPPKNIHLNQTLSLTQSHVEISTLLGTLGKTRQLFFKIWCISSTRQLNIIEYNISSLVCK
uniref:Uncharacterized LOC109511090 n=1 Tax=Hippocampus comes TaxID=109280 RepID=A0A3Q2Z3T2_HIPCM